MGQSPFFYYNPDPSPENRQHGHFTPHPHGLQTPTQEVPPFTSNMVFGRPSSSDSQTSYPSKPAYAAQALLTPVASPQPMYQKPTILVHQDSPYLYPLDTDCSDLRFAPSTPPLSSTGSAVSTPPSTCDILHTPMSGAFFASEGLEGVKQGCEEEVLNEILTGGDWNRAASPPMRPGTSMRFSVSYRRCLLRGCVFALSFGIFVSSNLCQCSSTLRVQARV